MEASEQIANASTHTNNWGVFVVDTAKAALPVGGGSFLATMHTADQFVTFATHLVGFCAAVVGFIWYGIRLRKDLRSAPKTPT